MSNPQKIKGTTFERDVAEILTRIVKKSLWKRVAGSGALGTIMGEPMLSSDVKGKVGSIAKEFRVECKVGYNTAKEQGVKQFTLKKEWLDKVKEEADRSYSIPLLLGKFSGAREGVKVFAVMDVEVLAELLNKITELNDAIEAGHTTSVIELEVSNATN